MIGLNLFHQLESFALINLALLTQYATPKFGIQATQAIIV